MALAHYLAAGDLPRIAAGESRAATAEDMKLSPADMRQFGFQSIAEVMDLCSAVSPGLNRASNDLFLTTTKVRQQFFHTVLAIADAARRRHLTRRRSLQPFMRAQCRGSLPWRITCQ